MITVAALLGGEKELGQKIKSRIDFDALIKKGIPLGVISHIKKEFSLTDEIIARIIGVSLRTISRRRKNVIKDKTSAQKPLSAKSHKAGQLPAEPERFSPVESDRIYRFARIVALAEDVFEGKDDALEWLNNPQYGLGGRIPFDMLQTDAGSREVEELLIRIDYGVIA